MPTIQISQRNFDRLLRRVESFDDTPDSVLERLLDEGDCVDQNAEASQIMAEKAEGLRLNPDAPDDLRFTRVRSASIGSTEIRKPNWNKLVRTIHQTAIDKLGSFREVEAITIANIERGERSESGFHYVPEAGISIQGLPAHLAWQCSLKLARYLDMPLQVVLEWHNKENAAHPGDRAVLEWKPTE